LKTTIDFLSYLLCSSYSEKFNRELKHISCSITPFFKNGGVYGILWKHTVEPGKIQIIIRRMRIACRILKANNTLSEHVTPIVSTATMVTRTRLTVMLHILPALFKITQV
jgi:hypothetical protein